jgi:hypothetical protein
MHRRLRKVVRGAQQIWQWEQLSEVGAAQLTLPLCQGEMGLRSTSAAAAQASFLAAAAAMKAALQGIRGLPARLGSLP